ncbi:MAG: hypothetical protein WCD18_25105 [Thermosynechococcaceae cyanobacterium]
MKSTLVFGLLCSLSILTPAPLPATAQTVPMQSMNGGAATVIPQSTAITVAFPAQMVIDAKQEQDYPTTLMLAQPLLDSYGNPLAPQGSPVAARVHPVKNGAQVIAESLVIQGRTVPIQATSPVLPSRKVTLKSGTDQAREYSPTMGRLFGGLAGGVSGGDIGTFNRAAMFGSGVGVLAGLGSEKTVQVVEIPQGSLYVLTLQAPVALALPGTAPMTGMASNPQFRFQTELEYQAGLDRVLQAYQQRQIAQADALNIIRAANTYATTQLPAPLYPPTQQRQLIGQLFGFTYAIDQSAPQVSNVGGGSPILF